MPEFNEWNNPPGGTAPADAYVPPGNTLEEKIHFCTEMVLRDDVILGPKCREWLKEVTK